MADCSVFTMLSYIYPHTCTLESAVEAMAGPSCQLLLPGDPAHFQHFCHWTLVAHERKEHLQEPALLINRDKTRLRNSGRRNSTLALEAILHAIKRRLTTGVQSQKKLNEFSRFLSALGFDLLCIRIGSDCVRHLFQRYSLFVPLKNKCYMQISGPPVHNMFPDSTIPLRNPLPKGAVLIGRTGEARKQTVVAQASHYHQGTFEAPVDLGIHQAISTCHQQNEHELDVATINGVMERISPAEMERIDGKMLDGSDIGFESESKTNIAAESLMSHDFKHARNENGMIIPTDSDSDSDSDECMSHTGSNSVCCDSDYDSDFVSNKKYREMRMLRRDCCKRPHHGGDTSSFSLPPPKKLRLAESIKIKKKQQMKQRRCSIHQMKLKKRRKALKKVMWRKNRKLRKQLKERIRSSGQARPIAHPPTRKRTVQETRKRPWSADSKAIMRGFIFYSTTMKEATPIKCVLNTLHPSMNGARRLVENIFHGHSSSRTGKEKEKMVRLPRVLKLFLPLFKKLLWNYRHKLHCMALLEHHCPIPEGTLPQWEGHGEELDKERLKADCAKLVKENLTHEQVFRFLRSVVFHLVPVQLFGSTSNRQVFFDHLKRFVDLRRWESMSVEMLTSNIKLSHCDWLRCPSPKGKGKPHPPQPRLFHKLISWLMEEVIVKFTKSFFYVTEHQEHRNHVFYFRKKVWSQIQEIALKLLEGTQFVPIPEDKVRLLLFQNKTLGISKLRFIPKVSKVRPIVNLGSKIQPPSSGSRIQPPSLGVGDQYIRKQRVESVNQQLSDVFHVLNYEKGQNPAVSGSTCYGYHQVHEKLKKFTLEQRKIGTDKNIRPFYFAHFDLSNCYDSILPDVLMEILTNDILTQEHYIIRRYSQVFISSRKIRRSFPRAATSVDQCLPFFKFAMDCSKISNNCIFVDQVNYPVIARRKVCELLRKHLFANVVKVGGQYYQQIRGIPQGSKLSSMLCGFYYADMESKCLPKINPKMSLLMRFVDDFLLITREKELARDFVLKLTNEIPAYNCTVNRNKGKANFKVHDNGEILLDEEVLWIEWCGLLINVKSMDVRVDYSRYSNIRDSVTIVRHSSPLLDFPSFIQKSLQLRCLPVLLDSDLVSEKSIQINVYQGLLLAGVKYLAYITTLPQWSRKNGYKPMKLERWLILQFFKVAVQCFNYYWTLARKRCTSEGSGGVTSSFHLAHSLCVWLGCHAFKTLLSHHQPKRLSFLIQLFCCKLDTISNTLGPELLKRCFRATRHFDSATILAIKC